MTTQLTQLTDVNISIPTNKQGLYYNSGSSKWENKSADTVDIVDKTTTQTLTNKTITDVSNIVRASQLLDIELMPNTNVLGAELMITNLTPLQCQFQKHDEGSLSTLSDVLITNPVGYNEALIYDPGDQLWKNKDLISDLNIVNTSAIQNLTNKTLGYVDNTINCNILYDVLIGGDAPTAGQVLTASGVDSAVWATPSIGKTLLSELNDVNIPTPVNKNLLIYDSGSSKWVNGDLAPGNIPDLSATYVTLNTTQNVSNKTLTSTVIDDVTNDVSANKIKGVSVQNGATVGYALIATSGSSASWQTIPTGSTTLASLTDCNINTPLNGEALIYNTAQGKWLNTDINLSQYITATSTNNLQNKTLSYLTNVISVDSLRGTIIGNNPSGANQVLISSNATNCAWSAIPNQTIAQLTDVLLTSVTNGDFLIYQTPSNKWINTASSAYVTLTGTQTLTNKTILNGTVRATQIQNVVISGTNPVAGQFLVATGATSGAWSNIVDSTTVFADDTDNTKRMQLQLNTLTTGTTRTLIVPDKNGTICMITDLEQSTILNKSSQNVQYGQTGTLVSPTYSDIISPCLFVDTGLTALQTPTQGNDSALHSLAQIQNMCTNPLNTTDNIGLTGPSPNFRLNVGFLAVSRLKSVGFYSTNGWDNSTLAITIAGFSSMQTATGAITGGTVLYSQSIANQPINSEFVAVISTGLQFQYYSIYGARTGGTGPMNIYRFPFNAIVGASYTPLYRDVDYTRGIDTNTGFPTYTKTNGTAQDVIYNLGNALVQEMYTRLFPVIRDTSTLKLTTNGSQSSIFLNNSGSKIWSIFAGNSSLNIIDSGTTNRLVITTTYIDLNTIRITTTGTILQNHVLKCTATGTPNTFTSSFVNLQELGDYDSTKTKTNNDILTYNTGTSKWEPKDSIILGTNNSVKLEESALDTLKLSSVNATYGSTFNFTNLLWSQFFNNDKIQWFGGNNNSTFGNSITLRVDNDTDVVSYQGGASSNLCTCSLNCFQTNQKWSKATNHYNTAIVNPPAGAYQVTVNDATVLRFTVANSQHCTLPFSGFIFPGWTVKIITGPGSSGTIFPNSSDTGATINDNNTVNQAQKISRTYLYIGIVLGVAQWWYDN
jgi:hypothetical protein